MPALRISVGLVVNPLIIGFAAISFMPARSAPSANSLTLRSLVAFTDFSPWNALRKIACGPQDKGRRFGQRFYCKVRFLGSFFRVLIVDEVIFPAARRLAGADVAPAVADHRARR